MNVSQIFHQKGEAHFRSLEKDFISHGHPQENCLVACGGGLCIPQGMMESLKKGGRWFAFGHLLPHLLND
jgi:shikimate kinase